MMLRLPTPFERGNAAPVDVDIELAAGEDLAFLAACAQAALDGCGADPESRAIGLLKYVGASLELRPHGGSATVVLRDGHAICAGMSRAFIALCRVSGIPCRDASMYGLRGMGSHAMAEAFYADSWHLFDPTFGTFFRSADGRICSLHQLLCDPEAGEMTSAVPTPWQGFDDAVRQNEPSLAPPDFMLTKYGFRLPERFREWFATAYPVTYRQAATSFPVRIDLRASSRFECLSPETAPADSDKRIGIDPDTGWTSVGFAFCHTVFLSASAGSIIKLYYRFTGEVPDIQIMGLASIRVLERRGEDDAIVFRLHTTADEAVAMVTARTFGRVASIIAEHADGDGA